MWSDDIGSFVINALSPAKVARIVIDDETNAIDVIVDEDQLALAIGRGGQNVRLASELTHSQLNIMTSQEAQQRNAEETARLCELFTSQLAIDENTANALVADGFTSIEEIAYVPASDLLEIESFTSELAEELRMKARDFLLQEASITEEKLSIIDEDLKNLDGMNETLLRDLAEANITNRDDLAELSVDELVEITGITPKDAENIIITARAHWF